MVRVVINGLERIGLFIFGFVLPLTRLCILILF
ncbi:MAG: hypothetical protein CM15mP117_04400 [Alphaproteobacteria bacterium]|nr:MAG: hypothetical protein CM15mP117_04400 [Alphaproteobacteria bacterium]